MCLDNSIKFTMHFAHYVYQSNLHLYVENYTGLPKFCFISCVFDPEKSPSLNQSASKQKAVATWSLAFSRASNIFLVLTSSSHSFLVNSSYYEWFS